jgi:ATP-dependent helicase HepA
MPDLLDKRVVHRFNPDLGPGRVIAIEGRTLVVVFPASGHVLRLAADTDALELVVFHPGTRAVLESTGERVMVEEVLDGDRLKLTDGRVVDDLDLWPAILGDRLFERLAQGDLDPLEDFSNRLDLLHLSAIREADGLGSFLGGRIQLFPHQLYAAERATRTDPVRWLLADEVGLGKTVEACLILNHLLRTARAERTLVVVPETLTIQWLGELWRKYHQVFVLLDDRRLADVERDYGTGFNPFDAHDRVVIATEMLRDNPWLTERAVESGIDLLIVDEAHRLRRRPGHPGNREYRAVEPIAALGRHVLLLTATPLEDDAHGFFRLLQLLRPEELPDAQTFDERLAHRDPLPPCTSATRRVDIGGLPPRVGRPVEIDAADQAGRNRLERAVLDLPAPNPVAARHKANKIVRAMSSGAALEAVLDRETRDLAPVATSSDDDDPRLRWLAENARRWREAGDKTLVFVAWRESLELIKTVMSRRAQLRVGVFHEEISPAQRDIEVAQFRLEAGSSMLVSTECGGEGRNFEFCTRLVLFDLPWDPMVVEQRIGRLDRIGRKIPVEIVYFRPPDGLGAAVAALYESLGLFRQPLGGMQRELAVVERAITEAVVAGEATLATETFESIVREAREADDRIREAAYHELHREPYRREMADEILGRVPPDLEELTEDVIIDACERLGLGVERQRGDAVYSVELGSQAMVESLPGVPGGSSFLGTFDRAEAVEKETIDFLASGHPLVEGILAHLEEAPRGRVTLLHATVKGMGQDAFGLLAIYKDGPRFDAVAVDLEGNERPEWVEILTRRPLRSKRVNAETWTRQPGWPDLVRSLATRVAPRGRPVAVAAFRIGG